MFMVHNWLELKNKPQLLEKIRRCKLRSFAQFREDL